MKRDKRRHEFPHAWRSKFRVNVYIIHMSSDKWEKICGYSQEKVSVWKETNGDTSFRTPDPPNFGSMSIPIIWVVISEKTYIVYSQDKVFVWKETNGDKCFRTPNPPNFGSMSIPFIWVVICDKAYVGTAKIKCLYEKRQMETPVSARLILRISGRCLFHPYK
jgi:hypothetical protein